MKRQYIDNHNQEVLQQREPFVEVLTHDSIVIQLPQIKQKRRNELEEILSIFELQNVQKFDMKFTLPEKYEEITKRLNLALTDEQIRNGMLAQEEMIHELESNAQAIATERKIKITAIQNLKKKGMSIVEIATIFDLSEEEINKLLL